MTRPPLSAAQSLVFSHLPQDGIPPATLARELGHSRQATAQLMTGLVQLGLVMIVDDPQRRRGKLVTLTTRGAALVVEAQTILRELEARVDPSLAQAMRCELPHLAGLLPPMADVLRASQTHPLC